MKYAPRQAKKAVTSALRNLNNFDIVNATNKHGQTPLMFAIMYGDKDSALTLIDSPCINLSMLDANGSAALMYAVCVQN